MKKRGLALLLAAAMALTLSAFPAAAVEEPQQENPDPQVQAQEEASAIHAQATGNWLTVDGIEGGQICFDSATGTITDCKDTVTKANIPSTIHGVSVTSIGDRAFYDCSRLTSVSIPSSVTSIGNVAFCNCNKLTSVSIPSSVTSIGEDAFCNCNKLTSVSIPSSVTSIGSQAFYGCSSLTSVSISDGVTSIGAGAFYQCWSLTSVSIPSSVSSIGNSAFYDCRSLTSVSIPSSVSSIGYAVFRSCSSLTSVSIPSSVTSIGSQAFEYCSSLTSVSIPSSVTSIGSQAFDGCSSLTSVSIPSSVTSIGNEAFEYCSSLTSVSIPSSVTSIENRAFYDCSSLTSIVVDANNPNYSSNELGVLFDKNKATLIQYPIGRTSTSYSIPSSVTTIGNYAFWNCSSLTSVSIPSSVSSIGWEAFYECSSLTSVSIPSSVTSIGEGAFSHCRSLTSVTISDGVTSIGDYAFYYCSKLTSVSIPSSVTSIGYEAFYQCSSLTSAYFEGNAPSSFGSGLFSSCAAGFTIYYPAGASGWTTPTWQGYKTVPLNTTIAAIEISPMDFGEIAINQSGCGTTYFLVKDSAGKAAPGVWLQYSLDGYSAPRSAVSDGNGIVSVLTPNQSAAKTYTVHFTPVDGNIACTGGDQTFQVKTNKLSYIRAWKGTLLAGGEIGFSAGAGVSVGPAQAEATAAKLVATGEVAGSMKIADTHSNGTRTVDLECTFSKGAGLKFKSGADASLFDAITITPAEATASAKINEQNALGIHLKNYNPSDADQALQVGEFTVLCSLLPCSQSVYAQKIANQLHWGANSYTDKAVMELEAGAALLGVKVGGEDATIAGGDLFGVKGTTTWTLSSQNNIYNNTRVIEKELKTEDKIGVGEVYVGGDPANDSSGSFFKMKFGDSLWGLDGSNTAKVSATTNADTGTAKGLSYTVYQGVEHNLAWGKESTDKYLTVNFSEEAAKNIIAKNSGIAKFAKGNFFAPGSTQDAIQTMAASGQQGAIASFEKNKTGLDGELPLGFSVGVSAKATIKLSGEESSTYNKSSGALYRNTSYVLSQSNVSAATVKKQEQSLGEFLAEPLQAAVNWMGEKIKDVCTFVKDGVQNAYASIKGTVSGWYGSVKSVVSGAVSSQSALSAQEAPSEEAQNTADAAVQSAPAPVETAPSDAVSYEIRMQEQEGGGSAFTVGDPYTVELYTDSTRTTAVTDEELAQNPVPITLAYTDDMLTAAGATADMDLYIFRYDSDQNLYILQQNCVQDKSAKTVTAPITKQGEYILGVDTAAPIFSNFMTSDNTPAPTITAQVGDMSGVAELTFSIDGTQYVTATDFHQYWTAVNGVFTFPVKTALADGSHTASFTAKDTLGNETAAPVTFSFETHALTAAISTVTVPTDPVTSAGAFTVSATTTDDSAFSGMRILLTTESGSEYTFPMTLSNGTWSGSVPNPSGIGTVTIQVQGADNNGNCVVSESKSVAVNIPVKSNGVSLSVVTASAESGGFSLVSKISYQGQDPMSGILTAAAYDAQGKMLCTAQSGAGLCNGETKNFSLHMDGDFAQVKTVKLFFLDGTTENSPICAAAEYTK